MARAKPPQAAKPPPLMPGGELLEQAPAQPAAGEPEHSARTRAEKAARAARVAEEMRLNLLKRKAQQRARRAKGEPG